MPKPSVNRECPKCFKEYQGKTLKNIPEKCEVCNFPLVPTDHIQKKIGVHPVVYKKYQKKVGSGKVALSIREHMRKEI